jgi:hypothetical protein
VEPVMTTWSLDLSCRSGSLKKYLAPTLAFTATFVL